MDKLTKRLKKKSGQNDFVLKTSCCNSFFTFFIPSLFRTLICFESFYFMASITCAVLGVISHEFFFAFLLIEVLIRIDLLKNVFFAIYVPRLQIIVTLILIIMMEYYFAMIGVKVFNDDYPEPVDTHDLLNTTLRNFDQTFKVIVQLIIARWKYWRVP